MDNTMDLYAELCVTPQAESEVIRAAFRALAQRYHPDRQVGATAWCAAKMARINQAYSVLSQPERRRAYDASRCAPSPQSLKPLIHITTTQAIMRHAPPYLTTYDARGRLHAFV